MLNVLRFRTRTWLIFLFGLAFFYFYSGGGPNQGTRFNLTRAILEEGRVTVDSFHDNSEDKAFFKGHYYCDKAPGASLFALPALTASRTLLKFVGFDTNSRNVAQVQMRVATWAAAGFPGVLLCLVIFDWMRRNGFSSIAATYSAVAVGIASPMWAYATMFWGNALASCCIVLAAYAVERLIRTRFADKSRWLPFAAGLATGGAVITEYPLAPIAVFLSLWLVYQLKPVWHFYQSLILFGIGAILVGGVLGIYNTIAFGNPIHLGYASVKGFEGMKQGLFGVTWPNMTAIAGVTWGGRGLLMTAPVLVLGLIGHVLSLLQGRHTRTAIVCLFCSIYPFLLNVSYVYWDGGWTYGPRHMASSLPFLAMGLAPLYDSLKSWLKPLAVSVLAGGSFLTLVAVSVHGMTNYDFKQPLPDFYWPSFWLGLFARHTGWKDAGGPATNFGIAMGLDNRYSLIPFWLALFVVIFGLANSLRKTEFEEI
jgi:hypothetical protein